MKKLLKILFYLFGLVSIGFIVKLIEGKEDIPIATGIICIGITYVCWKLVKRMEMQTTTIKPTRRKKTAEASRIASLLHSKGPQAAWGALQKRGEESGISEEKLRKIVRDNVPVLIDDALEDGILTVEEENNLMKLLECAGIDQHSCFSDSQLKRLAKAALIRDLLEGNVHPRFTFENLPFNLMKNEVPIWAENVQGYEHKTQTEYIGASQDVSIKIAKGMYWSTGAMKGRRVQHEVQESIGKGVFAITNMHLYFAAGTDVFRVKHNEIIRIMPTENSVVVNYDGARNKPLEFVVSDPWFVANALSNANNWA